MGPARSASTLIVRMDTIVRHVCLDAGGGTLTWGADVEALVQTVRNNFQSGVLGHVYQQVAKFLQCERGDQTMGSRPLKFDVLRRKAEAGVVPERPLRIVLSPSCARRMRPSLGPKSRV